MLKVGLNLLGIMQEMSSSYGLDDFEALFQETFNPSQFSNELLKVTSPNLDTNELDIKTALKKVKYDIAELDDRINKEIKENAFDFLDRLNKKSLANDCVKNTLQLSLNYLSMSFERLSQQVLKPYDHAIKLQSALSKIHQTSSSLRDALIYLHIATQIKSLSLDQNNKNYLDTCLKLASLHLQIKVNLKNNPNLESLELIKKIEQDIIHTKRQELLRSLSDNLSKECSDNCKNEGKKNTIQSLSIALFTLSSDGFITTWDKIISSKCQNSIQQLVKVITSIKNFDIAMNIAVKHGYDIHELENILQVSYIENSNLLREYLTQKNSLNLREIFWTRVSNSFQKDFEISFNRGGPVGKSLSANSEFIKSTISKFMPESCEGESYENELNLMMKSVSILDKPKS